MISGVYVEMYDSNDSVCHLWNREQLRVYSSNAARYRGLLPPHLQYSATSTSSTTTSSASTWCAMTADTCQCYRWRHDVGYRFCLTKAVHLRKDHGRGHADNIWHRINFFTASGGYVGYSMTDGSGNYITTVGVKLALLRRTYDVRRLCRRALRRTVSLPGLLHRNQWRGDQWAGGGLEPPASTSS